MGLLAPTISAPTPNVVVGGSNSGGFSIVHNIGDTVSVADNMKITAISGGTLKKSDDATAINSNDYISLAEGVAGVHFHPDGSVLGAMVPFKAASSVGTNGVTVGPTTDAAATVVFPLTSLERRSRGITRGLSGE